MGNFFKGISQNKGEQFEKIYFYPGEYLVEIQQVKFWEAPIGSKSGDQIIISSKILAVRNGCEQSPEVGQVATQHIRTSNDPYGYEQIAWINFMKSNFGEVTADWTDKDWSDQTENITGEHQPLSGKVLYLRVNSATTKTGTEISKHHWQGEPTPEILALFE